MPRKSRAKKPASTEATPVSETLESLKAELPTLRTAVDLPRAEQDPTPQEIITHPERDPIRSRAGVQGRPQARSFADTVDRPVFGSAPDGFFPAASRRDEGIRVLKTTIIRNGEKVSVAGIQFAGNRTPSRDEKDLLEKIHEPDDQVADKEKFTYQPQIQTWTREGEPRDALGDNVIDATRVMNSLADARKADRERMAEVLGR